MEKRKERKLIPFMNRILPSLRKEGNQLAM